ncbi:MAG: hypothetical protein U1E76_23805 [Planctomycetota bacterium]
MLSLLALATCAALGQGGDDVKHIASQDVKIGDDANQRYFLIGPRAKHVPPTGYRLVLVLPGGDGGADFLDFVKRIYDQSLPDDYVVAELVAPVWSADQARSLVWPTRLHPHPKMKFATEEFVNNVIKDVAGKVKIDKRGVFQLAWSSSGPAAYAISLQRDTPVAGSYIAMSVFHPQQLPPLGNAKGRIYFLDHSPDDETCKFAFAEQARDQLRQSGAKVEMVTYAGGHGWQGDVHGRLRQGFAWLARNAPR